MKMNLPNKITLFRLCCVPAYIVFIMFPVINETWSRAIACAIFILAALSDFADGYLARKLNLITDFGNFMDTIADKVMIIGAYVAICTSGLYRDVAWFVFIGTMIVIFREFLVTSIKLIAATSDEHIVVSANFPGKIKTVTQCISVVIVLIEPIVIPASSPMAGFRWLSFASVLVMSIATVVSGLIYLKKYKSVIFKDGSI